VFSMFARNSAGSEPGEGWTVWSSCISLANNICEIRCQHYKIVEIWSTHSSCILNVTNYTDANIVV
jgi:hypothetical protein